MGGQINCLWGVVRVVGGCSWHGSEDRVETRISGNVPHEQRQESWWVQLVLGALGRQGAF